MGGLKPKPQAGDPVAALAPQAGARPRAALFLVAAIAALAWGVTAWTALDMGSAYAQLAMPMESRWSAANAAAVFAMWSVMMAAMMLPSALPVLLLFAAMARKTGAEDSAAADSGGTQRLLFFAAGYVCVWLGFSALASGLQWVLQFSGVLEPMTLASTAPFVTASLLALAGVVQFTKLKQACLTACRSPLGSIMAHWRAGRLGAWRMGVRHGLFCLGCCWALMLLLFAFGAMNLLWVVLLALIVAIEKLLPRGAQIGRLLGAAMIAAAAAQLALAV